MAGRLQQIRTTRLRRPDADALEEGKAGLLHGTFVPASSPPTHTTLQAFYPRRRPC